MVDLLVIVALALAGAVAAGVPGLLLLTRLRRRSVTWHICVLVAATVLAVLVGVTLVAWEMDAMWADQLRQRERQVEAGRRELVAWVSHPYDGTVRVSAGQDRDTAWLAVADTCGGIPEAELPRVFEVAYRGESARGRPPGHDTGGGGLGLAIVRGLVEAQGGRVDVANSQAGCRFVVRLPVG